MALIFVDSFDHYVTADLDEKGWVVGTAASIQTTVSRNGGSAMLVAAAGTGTKRLALPSTYGTLIVGFAARFPSVGSDAIFFRFQEAGGTHVDLRHLVNGRLRVTRAGTTLGDGTAVLINDQWYYIEIKVTISDTVGVAVVRVNGVLDINLSSQDTRNGATGIIDTVEFEDHVAGVYIDDFYVADTSGGAPQNDFLGDIRVEALYPNANGNTSNLVGSDGNSTDNYLLVDEAAPNGDTDYVESSTVGDKDTYNYGALTPTSGTVFGVQIVPYARKTDAGVRSIKSVARHSATEVDGPEKTLNTTYIYLPDVRETKPGGGAWSISDVNGAEFGVKVSA